MNHLTRADYARAFQVLAELGAQDNNAAGFARRAVAALADFVACEVATLCVYDLRTGHRHVLGRPGASLRGSLGIQHAMAVPIAQSPNLLVSFVFNRTGCGFSERDRERLELLRPHLSYLYRHCCMRSRARGALVEGAALELARLPSLPPQPLPQSLTPREGEVLCWVARGKTDCEIAALLGLSPRTVGKHLEHVYIKLGVETRTAAVMRAMPGAQAAFAAASH